jgi:hypothetical protein
MAQIARTRLVKVSVLALCAGMAAACSTASDHTEVIKKFAEATGSVKEAMQAYDQAAAERLTMLVRARAVAQKKGLNGSSGPGYVIAPEDCQSASAQCVAFFKETRDDPDPKFLTYETIIPEHVDAARALADYADALKAVAEADSTAQVKAALDQAAAATSSLANIAQPGTGAAAQPLAAATANGLTWLYGQYQEKMKINALREATQRMNPHVKAAAELFGKAATLVDTTGRTAGAQAVDDAKAAFDENPSGSAISDLASSVNSLDGQLKVSPKDVFSQLAETHQILTDALVKGPESLAEIFESVNRLADNAEALANVAMQFKAAAEAKSTAMMMQ